MRPFLEKLPAIPNASWSLLNRRLEAGIPFEWHHHPEYELTLTLNSCGQRFIGDHVGEYGDGDLVLVGANLPHTWASRARLDPSHPHVALVMWFRHEWAQALGEGFAELRPIAGLLSRAQAGLAFSPRVRERARPMIEGLFEADLAERFLALVRVLLVLAEDEQATPLADTVAERDLDSADRERIDRVLLHIHTNYADGIANADLAEIAALSPSGLHRLFRRHMRSSISEYVMRLRIGEACARLSSGDQPIGHVAEAVGYRSLANFNRQFRALRGMTPRCYRTRFRG